MPARKKIDLDAVAEEEELVEKTVTYQGRDWTLITPNAYVTIQSFNPDEPHRFAELITAFIHPDEREDFEAALKADRQLKTNKMMAMLEAMSELVGEDAGPSSGS